MVDETAALVSISVSLYLNCSLTSSAMTGLSFVLTVVGDDCSSSAITALSSVLFLPFRMNSDRTARI